MMEKYWTDELDEVYCGHYPAFYILLKLPVNKENIIEQIINFEKAFLRLGHIYKIYDLVDDGKNIEDVLIIYEQAKRLQLADSSYRKTSGPNYYSLSSFGLLLFPNNAGVNPGRKYLNFPFIDGKTYEESRIFDSMEDYFNRNLNIQYKNILSFDIAGTYSGFLTYDEIDESSYLSMDIITYSNIWLDEIYLTIINHKITVFDKPVSNRYYSYQITPAYNSFLRDLHQVMKELGGSLEIKDRNKELVTSEGYILLDKQIIFKEDIESGKIAIPYY